MPTKDRCISYPTKYSGLFLFGIWIFLLHWSYSLSFGRVFSDPKNAIFYLGCGIFAAYATLKKWSDSFIPIRLPFIFLFPYFLIAAFSTIFSPSGWYEGLLEIARLFLWCVFAWGLTQLDGKFLKGIFVVSICSALVISMLNLAGLYSLQILPWPMMRDEIIPIGNVSYYGDLMIFHVPLCIYFIVANRKWRPVFIFASAAMLLGLWMSGTRASLVGIVAAIFFGSVLFVCGKIIRPKFIILALLVIVALMTAFSFSNIRNYRQEDDRFKNVILATSLGSIKKLSVERLSAYAETLKLIKKGPVVGWGLGSYRFIYPEYSSKVNVLIPISASIWFYHPHNEILNQAMEVGVFGCFLIVLLVVFVITKGTREVLAKEDGDEKLLLAISLMGFIAAVVSVQFSTSYLNPLTRFYIAIFVAVIFKYANFKTIFSFSGRKIYRWAAIALVIMLTLFLSAYYFSLYEVGSSKNVNLSHEKLRKAEIAYFLAPRAFDPLFNYSRVLLQTGNIARAASVTAALVDNYPYVPLALYLKAVSDLRNGNFVDAEKNLEHALKNEPRFQEAREMLSTLKDMSHPFVK